jgi:hypothetical protein
MLKVFLPNHTKVYLYRSESLVAWSISFFLIVRLVLKSMQIPTKFDSGTNFYEIWLLKPLSFSIVPRIAKDNDRLLSGFCKQLCWR